MTSKPEAGTSGFTLIELMISLGLFALIAVAGLALVDGIINVNSRTEGRLDRLATLQRTMFVIASDLDQVAAGPMEGKGNQIRFSRAVPGTGGRAIPVEYRVAAGTLIRIAPAPQLLLPGVGRVRWRFWDGGWIDHWPVDTSDANKNRWPRAVEIEMAAQGPGGAPVSLRRVVTLPVQIPEKKP